MELQKPYFWNPTINCDTKFSVKPKKLFKIAKNVLLAREASWNQRTRRRNKLRTSCTIMDFKNMSELSLISFRTNIMLNIEFSSSLFHVSLQNKLWKSDVTSK